jgi:hypothetical protein
MSKRNRYLEALKENYNLAGLVGAAALSAALVNPLPLLAGLVGETAYLLFVPASKWYDARLSARDAAQIAELRRQFKEQTFPRLSPDLQNRYKNLEATHAQITAYVKGDERWFHEMLCEMDDKLERDLNVLLERFLKFGRRETENREHLLSQLNKVRGEHDPLNPRHEPPEAPRGQINRWVSQVVAEIQSHYQHKIDDKIDAMGGRGEKEQETGAHAVSVKHIDVLRQRQEEIGKFGRDLINLNDQLDLLEDTFGLTNDRIRVRSPKQVLDDIENVISQTEIMNKFIEELDPYE